MDERTKNYKLISAEKNFHKNENLYRTIFNNTGTAMIIIEEDKTISLANQTFVNLSGYTREEIEGKKSWAEFVAKKGLNTMKEYHELRRTDPDSAPAYYEFQFINKHGKIKDIYLTVAMIPGTKQSVASLLDITDIKKTEKALRLSEEKYRLLAENISDIIWTMDMNLRFMYVSPSLETTTGYTPDEMMNLTLDKILTPDSFKAALNVFEEEKAIEASGMQNQVRTQSIELEEICKDGSTIWIEAKMSAIRDMEGRWVGILGVTRDITARKLAEDKLKAYSEKLEYMVEERTKELRRAFYDTEEARDKIDSILKSVAEGLIVTDIYDKIILMNSAAENLLNIRFNEAYGRHIDNAIQDIKLRERFKSTLEKKKTGYCFDFELPGENKKDPRIIRARTSMMSNKAGKHTGIIIIMYDVTYEREIDRMKSEFISIAAHELKTPLTSILGFSEILTKRKNISEEKKIKYIDYINKQSNKLANIIDDLLNIYLIESGLGFRMNKAPCNINKIILETIDYFQELCPARRFDTTLPEKSVEITADKDKIGQALKNIISNAIKYSPENSFVCLSARMIEEIKAKEKQPAIEISVSDKGIGMTSEQSKKIFDKFYRVDSSNKAISGSGLGMHIVKNIVEAHDGRIWVESKFEKGTTVTFTLPV